MKIIFMNSKNFPMFKTEGKFFGIFKGENKV